MKRHCCFIGCSKPAEFQITDEGETMIYDAMTDSCEDHLGVLIGSVPPTEPKGPWRIDLIESDKPCSPAESR